MFTTLSDSFYKWAKGWLVLVLLVLDAFFGGFLLPLTQGIMQGDTGGIIPLDLMVFAPPQKVFNMIERYGEFNRVFYRNVELTLDIIYPVVYLFFFGLAISWLFQRGYPQGSPMRKYNITPLGAWFFDLLENIVIVTLLMIFPAQPASLAWLLLILTTAKWFFAAASILLLVTGLFAAARNRFKIQ